MQHAFSTTVLFRTTLEIIATVVRNGHSLVFEASNLVNPINQCTVVELYVMSLYVLRSTPVHPAFDYVCIPDPSLGIYRSTCR